MCILIFPLKKCALYTANYGIYMTDPSAQSKCPAKHRGRDVPPRVPGCMNYGTAIEKNTGTQCDCYSRRQSVCLTGTNLPKFRAKHRRAGSICGGNTRREYCPPPYMGNSESPSCPGPGPAPWSSLKVTTLVPSPVDPGGTSALCRFAACARTKAMLQQT